MVEIRRCELGDIAMLQKLSIETFSDTFAAQNSAENLQSYLDRAYTLQQLTGELRNAGSIFYFAYLKGKLAGYLKINVGAAQTERIAENALEIERIYVRKNFKRQGVGKFLLDTAAGVAREKGLDTIWLGVWEMNVKALAFYEKTGFTQIGMHTFHMGDEEQTDYIMVKRI